MTNVRRFLVQLFGPLAVIHVWLSRRFAHWAFLDSMKSELLGPPPLITRPFFWLRRKWRAVGKTYRTVYQDQCLRSYSSAILKHYSRDGLAYRNLNDVTDQDKKAAYLETTSRLSGFIHAYPRVLPYKDAQSFLDGGCGKGQNIRGILQHYPAATIAAFDINDTALDVIRAGLGQNSQVQLRNGSLTDKAFMSSYPSGSVDHVVVSHVFSFLMGPSIAETHRARQEIVDELMRIARHSVFILDCIAADPRGDLPRVHLEQMNRMVYDEEIQKYWQPYASTGELLYLFSEGSSGILFVKSGPASR